MAKKKISSQKESIVDSESGVLSTSESNAPANSQAVEPPPSCPDAKEDYLSFVLKISVSNKNLMFKGMRTEKKRHEVFSRVCTNEILGILPPKDQKHIIIAEKLENDGSRICLNICAVSPSPTKKSAKAARILACFYSIAEEFRLSRDATYSLNITY